MVTFTKEGTIELTNQLSDFSSVIVAQFCTVSACIAYLRANGIDIAVGDIVTL